LRTFFVAGVLVVVVVVVVFVLAGVCAIANPLKATEPTTIIATANPFALIVSSPRN
jgi:hypothetical protein